MRYQRLDLNLLAALRALLTEKNVTRAGESLCVTQSSMSGILSRLREYFEDQLIVPVGRRMELTPLGESLVDKVNDLLLMIDTTLGTKPEFNPATSRRHFCIVASDYSISVLMLDVFQELFHIAPGVTVEFRQPNRSSYQEMELGEVDFIIAPEWESMPGISSCELFEDDYCAVVDLNNAEVGESLSLKQYLSGSHVSCMTNGSPMFEMWFAKKFENLRRIHVNVPGFVLLPKFVVGTDRIATLHSRQALIACRELPVRRVRLDFECPNFIERLLWHKYRDNDPGIQWMCEFIVGKTTALSKSGQAFKEISV